MKSIVLTLLGIISFSFSLGAQKQSVNSDVQSGKNFSGLFLMYGNN